MTNEMLEVMRREDAVYSMLKSDDKRPIKNLLAGVRNAQDQGVNFYPQDFAVFRDPKFPETVVALDQINPNINRYEKGEILKYMSIFPDTDSLNIWFSNRKLMEDMSKDENSLFTLFMTESVYNLPVEVRSRMVTSLIEIGDTQKAALVSKTISETTERERKEREYLGESY